MSGIKDDLILCTEIIISDLNLDDTDADWENIQNWLMENATPQDLTMSAHQLSDEYRKHIDQDTPHDS